MSPGVSAARRQEGSVPCCVAGWLWIPALEFVFAGNGKGRWGVAMRRQAGVCRCVANSSARILHT